MQLHVSFKNSLVLKRSTADIADVCLLGKFIYHVIRSGRLLCFQTKISRDSSHARAHECASVFVRNN